MNKYTVLKILSVLIAAFSQILLKKSADKKYPNRIREYLNVLVIVGYGLFVLSSLFSVFALKGISISFSMVIESLSYIIVPVLSYFLLKEDIKKETIIGMIVIVIGTILFNL